MNTLLWQSDEMKAAFAKGHATGLQTAEGIGEVVVFLTSDESRNLTGAVLNCGRGWTAFKQPDLLALDLLFGVTPRARSDPRFQIASASDRNST